MNAASNWPELPYEEWKATCQTLHRWTQVIGKIRISKTPWLNHSWHSPLYLSERGLTTSLIHDEQGAFSVELDFLSHRLRLRRDDGRAIVLPLVSETVASFHEKCFMALRCLGLEAVIHPRPNELPDAIPFAQDELHRTYDADAAQRFWRILLRGDRLMKEFRSRFSGKSSPVHFFWGSFDLAATRFSGRRAPEHPGGVPNLPDLITREAYSDEVSSCGFWPGNEQFPRAAFYSYAYPQPEGFAAATVPKGAYFENKLREFVLPLDRVRESASPDELVLEFFQATYEAAAELGRWDRASLEGSRYLRRLQATVLHRVA